MFKFKINRKIVMLFYNYVMKQQCNEKNYNLHLLMYNYVNGCETFISDTIFIIKKPIGKFLL